VALRVVSSSLFFHDPPILHSFFHSTSIQVTSMSDEQHGHGAAATLSHSGSRRSRSRSHERNDQPPRRQLRSHTGAAAADEAAYGNHPQSISRLHDDELSCVLTFLSLKDLTQLVRCSRRFNAVARKERSRELHLRGSASFATVRLLIRFVCIVCSISVSLSESFALRRVPSSAPRSFHSSPQTVRSRQTMSDKQHGRRAASAMPASDSSRS
jgi:hypothetical protein